MHTQVDQAQKGRITHQMQAVARSEGIDPHELREGIAEGSIVIMQRGKRYSGIGKGLVTKVNVNLGTSSSRVSVDEEIRKAQIADAFGADTISDLSMGGNITDIRNRIFSHTGLPLTTVPIYQSVAEHGLENMTAYDIMETLRMQADQGVSSVVIHAVNHEMLGELRRKKRILGVVSKGGSITSAFMLINQCNNPFVEQFGEVLSICRQYDIVLSLGNTARSGCIQDRRDRMQLAEIRQNVQFAHRAHSAGVQVIIEGAGGHIRLDRIAPMVKYYKRLSPFPLFVPARCRQISERAMIISPEQQGPVLQALPGQITCATSLLPNISVFRTGCGKRRSDCVQDRGAYRGHRKIWQGGRGYPGSTPAGSP